MLSVQVSDVGGLSVEVSVQVLACAGSQQSRRRASRMLSRGT